MQCLFSLRTQFASQAGELSNSLSSVNEIEDRLSAVMLSYPITKRAQAAVTKINHAAFLMWFLTWKKYHWNLKQWSTNAHRFKNSKMLWNPLWMFLKKWKRTFEEKLEADEPRPSTRGLSITKIGIPGKTNHGMARNFFEMVFAANLKSWRRKSHVASNQQLSAINSIMHKILGSRMS